jgi:hypothetical protein
MGSSASCRFAKQSLAGMDSKVELGNQKKKKKIFSFLLALLSAVAEFMR